LGRVQQDLIHVDLSAKGKTVLQGKIDGLTEIGRCCGMEMNVEKKIRVKRISRQLFPVQIMLDQIQLKNVEYFSLFILFQLVH
jgi:hypothetical protein